MVAELEAHYEMSASQPPLTAAQYRSLWLDAADELGLAAETLACALGWQASEAEPLPDALELAQAAAERLVALEAQIVFDKITRQPTAAKTRHIAFLRN